jgi:hypothetical protein
MTNSSSQSETQFYPFHAINEFMRPDYRLTVVRAALGALPNLPASLRQTIDRITKQVVKVPGFRHAEKAPTAVKILPMTKAFEKSPDLAAAILAAWAETHTSLRQQVYDLLKLRGWTLFPESITLDNLSPETIKAWGILPPEVDRTRLPGFLSIWPKDNDFEAIYKHFTEQYPDVNEGIDNVSLMVVWLSMRLPVEVEGREDTTETDAATPSAE